MTLDLATNMPMCCLRQSAKTILPSNVRILVNNKSYMYS